MQCLGRMHGGSRERKSSRLYTQTTHALHCERLLATVPDQPTNLAALLTMSGTVMVQWEEPQLSADVEGYIISYSPTGSSCEGLPEGEVAVNGSETTQLEVSGMAAGVEYDVQVAAFNSIGTGAFSMPPARVNIPEKSKGISVLVMKTLICLCTWRFFILRTIMLR